MANFQKQRNTSILKNMGVEDWVLCSEELKDFISWFDYNIDESNVLSENEIAEYNEIIKNDTLLSGDELTNELKRIDTEFPNILSYTPNDVMQLEQEPQQKINTAETYERLAEQQQLTINTTKKTIIQFETELASAKTNEQTIIDDCIELAKQLEHLQADNYQLMHEFNHCYTKDQQQTQPLFMCQQMSLEKDFYQKCKTISNSLNVYMQNKYKTKDLNDFSAINESLTDNNVDGIADNDNMQSINNELEYIKQHFQIITNENILQQMTNYATEELIKDCQLCPTLLTETSMTREIDEINAQKPSLTMQINAGIEEIKLQVQELAEQKIELIVAENNNEKLQRAIMKLNELKELSDLVNNVLISADILWCAMQFDLDKLKARRDFDKTDRLRKERMLSIKRLNSINALIRGPTIKGNSPELLFLQEFQAALGEYVKFSLPNNIMECLNEYEKLSVQMPICLDDIIKQHRYKSTNENLDSLKLTEKVLTKFFQTGPIKRVNLENIDLVEKLYNLNVTMAHLQQNIQTIKTDLMDYRKRFQNDKFWHNKSMLWIWFLTEPQLVCDAIREIKIKVNTLQEPKQKGPKMIAGLKRQI